MKSAKKRAPSFEGIRVRISQFVSLPEWVVNEDAIREAYGSE